MAGWKWTRPELRPVETLPEDMRVGLRYFLSFFEEHPSSRLGFLLLVSGEFLLLSTDMYGEKAPES
jgi:hypothetical protein